jgi:hypothetical protein
MPSKQPNVVFMLADNLGYGDVGCYGSGGEQRGMPTPRIDGLATEGAQLNQFLVEAGCTPSRAALMTGRYSIRAGLSLIAFPGSNELRPDEFSLGDLFKSAGYRTAYYGKWHLGQSTDTEPQFHGFDEWRYGFYGSSDGTLYGDSISRTHGPAALLEASGQPIVFSHGWPLSADDWDAQLMFFLLPILVEDVRRVGGGDHGHLVSPFDLALDSSPGFPHGMPTTEAETINADLLAFVEA